MPLSNETRRGREKRAGKFTGGGTMGKR